MEIPSPDARCEAALDRLLAARVPVSPDFVARALARCQDAVEVELDEACRAFPVTVSEGFAARTVAACQEPVVVFWRPALQWLGRTAAVAAVIALSIGLWQQPSGPARASAELPDMQTLQILALAQNLNPETALLLDHPETGAALRLLAE